MYVCSVVEEGGHNGGWGSRIGSSKVAQKQQKQKQKQQNRDIK